MALTDIFIKRPVLSVVVSLLILLIGLRAAAVLPIRQYPKLSNTVVNITTSYPGASADLIQGFITTPIEQAVASAEGVDYITSSSVLGTSTTTAYIESTAGVSVGGRTGLTAVTTGFWFIVSLVAFPVFGLVANNPAVTAPALIVVGVLMAKALGEIEWAKLEYAIPAFLIVAAMPLTYSISNGIALGLVFFPVMMAAKGRWRDVHPIAWVLMLASAGYFLFLTE